MKKLRTVQFWVAQTVKNLPTMQQTRVQSLGWEDPLEKGMTTPSRILAWTIPWTEEPSRLQSMGLQRVRHDWATNTFTRFSNKFRKREEGEKIFSDRLRRQHFRKFERPVSTSQKCTHELCDFGHVSALSLGFLIDRWSRDDDNICLIVSLWSEVQQYRRSPQLSLDHSKSMNVNPTPWN